MQKLPKAIVIPPAIVFVVTMVLVLILYFSFKTSVERDINNTISDYSRNVEETVKERFDIFDVTLRAGQGLLSGNPNATQEQWQQFIDTSTVMDRYTSVKTINYAKISNDYNDIGLGNEGDRAVNLSVDSVQAQNRMSNKPVIQSFTAPDNAGNRLSLGKDISTNTSFREAMSFASENGVVTIAGANDSSGLDEYAMFAPQYKVGMPTNTIQQRQEAIEGFTYAIISPDAFSPNDNSRQKGVAYAVKGTKGGTIYKSEGYDEVANNDHSSKLMYLDVADTKLGVKYIYDAQSLLPRYNVQLPTTVLLFGSLLASLISFSVWLVLASKARSLLLAQERDINYAKDSLLSLASHQLRTPATGVKQYLGMVLQGFFGDISPKQREMLEKANRSNERQLRTINDILYVARLGSGRIVLTKTLFVPTKLVQDIVRDMNDSIADRQHVIKVMPQAKDKEFYGDEHMIRMAVENLISNAVKYTPPKGTITISVSGSRILKICVKDTGVGIPENKLDHLFKQFSRIDNELSVSVGGTGIGLYVVKNIANLHNGTVGVSTNEGKGSSFWIALPYIRPPKM